MHYSSILETANHFRCIDILIDRANGSLSENLIKELHLVLKNGTSDSSGSIHFRMEMAGSVAWLCLRSAWNIISCRLSSRMIWRWIITAVYRSGIVKRDIWRIPVWRHRIDIKPISITFGYEYRDGRAVLHAEIRCVRSTDRGGIWRTTGGDIGIDIRSRYIVFNWQSACLVATFDCNTAFTDYAENRLSGIEVKRW